MLFRSTVNTGEGIPIHEPENFDPVTEIVTYLETLFEAGDNVGYVTETWVSTRLILHTTRLRRL